VWFHDIIPVFDASACHCYDDNNPPPSADGTSFGKGGLGKMHKNCRARLPRRAVWIMVLHGFRRVKDATPYKSGGMPSK